MRKIESNMLAALNSGKFWQCDNTMVHSTGEVFLHGNHIATVKDEKTTVNLYTLRRFPSNTTKSRLRALGVNLTQKKYELFLDGVKI